MVLLVGDLYPYIDYVCKKKVLQGLLWLKGLVCI